MWSNRISTSKYYISFHLTIIRYLGILKVVFNENVYNLMTAINVGNLTTLMHTGQYFKIKKPFKTFIKAL